MKVLMTPVEMIAKFDEAGQVTPARERLAGKYSATKGIKPSSLTTILTTMTTKKEHNIGEL